MIAIVPTADRAKATVKVRIAIDTRDERLVPEMGVRVSFLEPDVADAPAAATPPGVLVPAAALVTEGDRAQIWLVGEGRARKRDVVLGQAFGTNRQVLEGLAPGERVVVAPPAALTDGARVRERGAAP